MTSPLTQIKPSERTHEGVQRQAVLLWAVGLIEAQTAAAIISRLEKMEQRGEPPPNWVDLTHEAELDRSQSLCSCGRPATHLVYNSETGRSGCLCSIHFRAWRKDATATQGSLIESLGSHPSRTKVAIATS